MPKPGAITPLFLVSLPRGFGHRICLGPCRDGGDAGLTGEGKDFEGFSPLRPRALCRFSQLVTGACTKLATEEQDDLQVGAKSAAFIFAFSSLSSGNTFQGQALRGAPMSYVREHRLLVIGHRQMLSGTALFARKSERPQTPCQRKCRGGYLNLNPVTEVVGPHVRGGVTFRYIIRIG